MRLRTLYILSYAFILAIVLVIFFSVSEFRIKPAVKALSIDQLQETSYFAASTIESYLESAFFFLQKFLLKSTENFESLSKDQIIAFEASFEDQPYFSGMMLLDEDGRLLYSFPRNFSLLGLNLSRQYFQEDTIAARGPSHYFTNSLLSLISNEPTVSIVYQLPTNQRLIVDLNLNRINSLFEEVPFKENSQIMITDRLGTVIVSPDQDQVLNRKNIPFAMIQQSGSRFIELDRQTWLGFVVPIQMSNWRVVLLYPEEVAFYAYNIFQQTSVVGILSTIMVLIFVILAISNALTLSLDRIQEVISKFLESKVFSVLTFESGLVRIREFENLKARFSEFTQIISKREHELIRAQKRFETIVNNIPSVVFRIRAQNNKIEITYLSPQAEKLLGPENMALTKNLDLFKDFIFPEDIREFEFQLGKAAAAKDLFMWAGRIQLFGNIRWIQIKAQRSSLEEEDIWDGVIDEVTNQVKFQESMIQQEKMLMIGSLSAGMAHEIKNPLSAIFQSLEIIESLLKKSPDEHPQKKLLENQLDFIKQSGIRINIIIRDLLAFSRQPEEGKELHDIIELIKTSYDLFHRSIREEMFPLIKRVKVDFHVLGKIPPVPCFPNLIEQVFINLFQNAFDAFCEIQSERKEFIIDVMIASTPDKIEIKLRDNGPGIPEKIKRRIFEPFYTTKAVGKGTGLGLAICYFIIVTTHHGSIEVESYSGQGTTFIISLPLNQEESAGKAC